MDFSYSYSLMNDSTSVSNSKKLTKHEIIRRYKQKQRQKQILKNKINVLKNSYERNHKKTKSIQISIKKINQIKSSYIKDKNQIQTLAKKNHQQILIKKQKATKLKQNIDQKLPYIKSSIEREKSIQYKRSKKMSTVIQNKIKVFKNQLITERKIRASRIKQAEKLVPIMRKSFLQNKKRSTLKSFSLESSRIQKKYKKSQQQIQNMKNLEESLIKKLNQSQTILNKNIKKSHVKLLRG